MANLTSITVSPSNPYNLVSTTRAFTATATFSDAPPADVTLDVTTIWTSSDLTVATISNSGPSKGTATTQTISGSTIISATYGGKTGTTVLRVGLVNYTRILEPTVEGVKVTESSLSAAHNPIQKLSVPNISLASGGVTFLNATGNAGGPIGYTTASGHPGDFSKLYIANEVIGDGYWVQLNAGGLATTSFSGGQRNLGVAVSTAVDVSGNQLGSGGAPILVQLAGEAYVFATSSINQGDFLGPDTSGRVKTVPFVPSSPTPILGFALESDGATYNGMVLMRIQICGE